MASATIFRPKLGPVEISVSIRETHMHNAQVSDHPIETGSVIADHIHTQASEVIMEGVIGGDFGNVDDDGTFVIDPDAPPAPGLAYSILLELYNKREVFDVVTGLATYRNMAFKSFGVTRDARSGSVLSFTASLKEIRFASATLVELKVDVKEKAGSTKQLGEKPTTEAPASAADAGRSSVLSDLLNAGGGF